MDHGGSALARLILVVVTWSEWAPKKDRKRYEQFIEMFLRGSWKHSGCANTAYMHQLYQKDHPNAGGNEDDAEPADNDIRATQWVEQAMPYELPPKFECRSPDVWLDGEEALKRVTSVSEAERGAATAEADKLVHQVSDWGRLFRTRLFMHADCYRAALDCHGGSDYWVLIDLSFQRVSKDSVLWHTSFSFWSDPPRCSHHCPDSIDGPESEELKAEDAYKLMDDWHSNSVAALQKQKILKDRKTMRVSGRSYLSPSFLVAVPVRRSRDTAAAGDMPEHGHPLSVLPQVSNEILWTQNFESLPHALLKGGVNAFRRFLPYGNIDQPRYLLIPDTRTPIRSRDEVGRWYQIQEEATAVGVQILTNLEAYAASELGGIGSRMQIRKNHLRIYQGVAEQAGTLWDALARLLPDARKARLWPGARKRGLEIVHRSIEMIHQTLLQGVADLDQLVRNINGAQSHIEATADEVADRFDRQLDHPPSPGEGTALRESLRGGPLDRLRREVKEASSDADRVTESYRTLLETIGMAFDERRVREGDRLQRASVWLAVAFGVLGLSGVAQATLPLPQLDLHDHRISFVKWILWLATAIVICAMLLLLLSPQLRGKVASRGFERRYVVVRDFLAEVSTDHLDEFRRGQRPPDSIEPDYPTNWHGLDERLSKKFINAWTISSRAQAAALRLLDPYGAAGLRSRVEAWTLQTLMLTERPRDFSRYRLPYLTSLYRVCTAKALRDWRVAEEMPNADSAVGMDELKEALPYGYKWLSAHEAAHIEQEPEDIYKWLKAESGMGTERHTMEDYVHALVNRADFSGYFTDDVVVTIEGTGERADGREAAAQLIRYMHEEAFDAHPELKNLLVDEGKAAIEADLVGTHTGEFAGVQPTGRAVRVPYSVVYDLRDDQISKLRIYFPMSVLVEQLTSSVAGDGD